LYFENGTYGHISSIDVTNCQTRYGLVGICLVAGADCGASIITAGRVGALTDFLGSQTLSNIDASGDMAWLQPVPNAVPVLLKTYAAGVLFQIDVTTALGGATNYVDLFGWLKDA